MELKSPAGTLVECDEELAKKLKGHGWVEVKPKPAKPKSK